MARDDKKTITTNVHNSMWFLRNHNNTAMEYTTGKVIGTMGALNVRGYEGGGLFRILTVTDSEKKNIPFRIWFFRYGGLSVFTNGVDFLPSRNDFNKVARYVDINAGDYQTYGGLSFLQKPAINVDFNCPDGWLRYYVEARGTATFANANSLDINLGDWPD